MRNKNNIIATLLSGLLIVLLVIGFISVLSIYTNDFTTGIKTFYVKCGNDSFLNNREDYIIVVNKTYRFDIQYPFNVVSESDNGYYVNISPNITEETTFDFTLDGAIYGFTYLDSLSKGFDIKTYSNYFTITATSDLKGILEKVYSDKLVDGDIPSAINSGISYFKLNISSANKNEKIIITFKLVQNEQEKIN